MVEGLRLRWSRFQEFRVGLGRVKGLAGSRCRVEVDCRRFRELGV